MSDPQQIKEIIKQEYIRCYNDPVHFFKKYCYIKHPQKGRILFHLYPFQEGLVGDFKNHRFLVINKSRQLGISTLVAAYSLWMMLFNRDKTILCVATKQETAKGMVEKVQFMYSNLPTWLKGKEKPLSDNVKSFKLPNNSEIIATSAAADTGRSYAVSLLIIDEAAFVDGIGKIYTSIKPTVTTGGGIIALSSPNGIGNWFHKTFTESESGTNEFYPITLPWNLHPDRDAKWEESERMNMSPREFAQEYACDFLGSGNSVVDNDILSFYEQTYIRDPVERRFMGNDFWIWEYADFTHQYVITADVARGDSSDYSAFHVIDVNTCEQVAEYKSQIDTRTFGNMLVSVASEYNNGLIVVDNSNIGWDVVNTIIDKSYPNLYYSPKTHGDVNMDKWLTKMETDQTVPGFTLSTRTRPLVISKMEQYIREKSFIFHSKRLLGELRVFLWLNGKAQAQSGYNDDLVMSLGTGLFVRDTAMKFYDQSVNLAKQTVSGIQKANLIGRAPVYPSVFNRELVNPYQMPVMGQIEDITWLL